MKLWSKIHWYQQRQKFYNYTNQDQYLTTLTRPSIIKPIAYGAKNPQVLAAALVMPYMVPAYFGLKAMWFIWLPAYTAPAKAPGIASMSCIAVLSQPNQATPKSPREGTTDAKVRQIFLICRHLKRQKSSSMSWKIKHLF